MNRFDYVQITKVGRYNEAIVEFVVFDRIRGCTIAFAKCNERDDAEMIVRALNGTVK